MGNELYIATIYIYLLQISMFGKSTISSEINKVNRIQIEGWSNADNREFTIKTDQDSDNFPTTTD